MILSRSGTVALSIAIVAIFVAAGFFGGTIFLGSRHVISKTSITASQYRVTPISLQNGSVLKLAESSDGKEVFALDSDSGLVSIINSSTQRLLGQIVTDESTSIGIAYANGGLFVSSQTGQNVVSLNPASSAKSIVSIGARLGDIVFVPQQDSLYVASGDSASIYRVSLVGENASVLDRISVPCPQDLAYDIYRLILFATDACTNSLFVISVASANDPKIIGNLSTGNNPIGVALNEEEGIAYVANANSNSISVVNYTSMMTLTKVALGKDTSPTQIAFDTDRQSIFVTEHAANLVVEINASTLSIVQAFAVSSPPYGILYDSYARSIYVADGPALMVITMP